MRVLVRIGDAALRAQVAGVLGAAGHELEAWEPGRPGADAAEARVAVIDDLALVAELRPRAAHLFAVVDPADVDHVPDVVGDFVVRPVGDAELSARIRRLGDRPSRAEERKAKLLATAVEAASDVIELTTPDAVLEYVNPAFERVFGYPAAEAIGRTPAMLVRSDMHERAFFQELDATLRRGETWRGVLISRTRDGRIVHMESTIAPVTDSRGEVINHIAVKRDITERIEQHLHLTETNRALERARDAALSASRAKSEFLANMSHELRTPLNAILGYSEMLMEDSDDAQTIEDLRRIRSAGVHLLGLIDDVLDISKIEAEKIQLYPEQVAIAELVGEVTATIEPLAQSGGNRFAVECAPDPGTMTVDRKRLRQILLNLLSNACKFTKNGSVTLRVRVVDERGRRAAEFAVEDTGIGISEEQRERLFQPFSQADSSTTREYGGTGLGLVISQRLAQMMGGGIALDSEPGRGSTFTLRVPMEPGATVSSTVGARDARHAVLVIDDDAAVRDVVARSLAKRGYRVHCVADGKAGIEHARRLQPDAIVLDVRMPGMSGWEVLSTLKLSDTTAGIPVIMLTIAQQRELGYSLGAVDYLQKPIDTQQLSAALRRHVRSPSAHVLVVEDDEPTRELIRRTLASAGHRVTVADNGQTALDELDGAVPDIVVLDLMMPVMDGVTFLHRVRADARFAQLPVLVATARVLSAEERAALDAMVERVIDKGAFNRGELLRAISEQVEAMLARAGDARG